MVENEGFMIQPASMVLDAEIKSQLMSGKGMSMSPSMEEEAWMKYIIEFHLPPDLEQMILMYVRPLINLAPKSNIRRGEIPMYLIGYDLIWDEYFIYMRKGKYDPQLIVIKGIIREALKLQLCRSIGGWLGKLMQTKMFQFSQSNEDRSNVRKGIGLFRRKPKEGDENR